MRAFAEAWRDDAIVQEPLAQLTWYHNITLLEKIASADERLWYAQQAIEAGWSRNVLVHQIESGLYSRQGRALTNFANTLPPTQSDLARHMLKDPYNFDFLSLNEDAQERDLERGLIAHLQAFLLEMGVGFAFVGSQYHLDVGNQDFYIDLLFYHLRLRCYIAVDLKIGDFQPEYVGKMNFYLAALDASQRHPTDQPSIGLILCKSKNHVIVEYTLRDMQTPIGVAEYHMTQAVPDEWKGSLPTIEELERTLGDDDEE